MSEVNDTDASTEMPRYKSHKEILGGRRNRVEVLKHYSVQDMTDRLIIEVKKP